MSVRNCQNLEIDRGGELEPGGSANQAVSLKINPQRSGVAMTVVAGGFEASGGRNAAVK